MPFYRSVVLPRLIHSAMRQDHLVPYRHRLVATASGTVLEVGIGSGLNLPHYPAATSRIIGLDPAPKLLARARHLASSAARPVDFVEGSAEAIPLDSASVDTVVTSWTLCSVSDVAAALAEMQRVLRPGGALVFVEHGRAPDARVVGWQNRLTPVWKRIAGGCHLNRPIDTLVESAGFVIERLDTGYAEGPRPMAFMYEGRAVRRG
ncbi:MAG TPA: class I SAM-dependent methyltransferase [Vicinamibacterales bacterium]|nr:class I SAM-dependent methyltransferase [Vicinamibacterales bacterium]